MSRADSGADLASRASIAEEAAEWLLTLQEEGLPRADKESFVAWLKVSPVHVQEFLRISSLDAELMGRPLGFDVETLLAECRELPRIDEIGSGARGPTQVRAASPVSASPQVRFWTRPRLAAAFVLTAVSAVLAITVLTRAQPVYTTERGEQRVVSLPDGSLMELNTQSRVQVAYDAQMRTLILQQGEALFVVAKNPNRPFVVQAGGQSIRATGTRFNVSVRPSRTVVTVIEGSVVVAHAAAASAAGRGADLTSGASPELRPSAIRAGEQLVVTDMKPAPVHAANANRAVAWQEWKLYFDEDSLATAVEEFNRYNRQQLAIADAELAQRRISGVFFANQPDSLLAFIASRDAVEVTRTDNTARTIRLKRNSASQGPTP